MPIRAGQIVIDITAGTGKFVVDMEQAKAKIREFGSTGVSETKATRAAFKALEGQMFNNSRAAEQFAEKLLGVGTIAKVAFPIVGGLAFGGMLSEVGTKVHDFFKTLQDAPEKAAGQWGALTQSLHLSNAELDLTNAKLEQDIAKLEGKRHNGLAVMLEEARVAALKLGAQLDKDIQGMYKLFREQDAGFFGRLFGGADNRELEKLLGGETSYGGLNAQLRKVNEDEDRQLEAVDLKAKNAKEQIKAITDAAIAARRALLDTITKAIDPKLQEALRLSVAHKETRQVVLPTGATIPQSVDIAGSATAQGNAEVLSKAKADAAELIQHMNDVSKNSALMGRKEDLQAGSAQVKKDQEALNRLNQELVSLQDKHLEGLDKIAAEEKAEIERLTLAKSVNESTLAVVRMISEQKLRNLNVETSEKLAKQQHEQQVFFAKQVAEFDKAGEASAKAYYAPFIKYMDELSKAQGKLFAEHNKLFAQGNQQNLDHTTRMIGITGQRSGDVLGTLHKQQEAERAVILNRYNEQVAEASTETDKLSKTVKLNNAELEKGNALHRLDNQFEEQRAALRRQSVGEKLSADAYTAKTPSDIANDAIGSAEDKLADQFAKALTGQKTGFVQAFKGIAEQGIKEGYKSIMQRGLGSLAEKFGIHKGKADGYHMWVDNLPATTGAGTPPVTGAVPPAGFSNLAGIMSAGRSAFSNLMGSMSSSGATESVSSGIQYMAEGGDIYPGNVYGVAEKGEAELISPKGPGTVTPLHKLGTHNYHYSIDARGAELGVEHRVAHAIEEAHDSAVNQGVRASTEHARRTPQRSS